MMMKISKLILFISILSFPFIIRAQEKDFGIWYGISAEKKLTKKIEADLSACIRTFNSAAQIEEGFIDGGISWKIIKNISVGGAYRFTLNIENDGAYHPRHKWFFDVRGSADIADLTVSGRFRLQERFKTYYEDEDDKVPDFHGRYRLKIIYNTPSFPVNPYISAEIFCPMFSDTKKKIDKERYIAGLEYKLSGNHSLEFEYLFQRDYRPDLMHDNIISINYKIEF